MQISRDSYCIYNTPRELLVKKMEDKLGGKRKKKKEGKRNKLESRWKEKNK